MRNKEREQQKVKHRTVQSAELLFYYQINEIHSLKL